jgi:hypothetical protein
MKEGREESEGGEANPMHSLLLLQLLITASLK